MLIACNHPNSFLDAIIISSLFKKPVHSLARGDAFKNKFFAALLRSLNMLPVYRASEGVENMEHNYTSFNACKEIFKKNGIVLIFSEGRCINEWHLRPLMKGTARLVLSSWNDDINVKILPLGINYQSFTSFGKNIHLNAGEMILPHDINTNEGFGNTIRAFNAVLNNKLQPLVYEIDKNNLEQVKQTLGFNISTARRIALSLPAVVGYMAHWPLYFFIQRFAFKVASHNDHYDSIIVGLLFLLYPFYLLFITGVVLFFTKCWYFLFLILVLPFCAFSFVQVKKQF